MVTVVKGCLNSLNFVGRAKNLEVAMWNLLLLLCFWPLTDSFVNNVCQVKTALDSNPVKSMDPSSKY